MAWTITTHCCHCFRWPSHSVSSAISAASARRSPCTLSTMPHGQPCSLCSTDCTKCWAAIGITALSYVNFTASHSDGSYIVETANRRKICQPDKLHVALWQQLLVGRGSHHCSFPQVKY